MSTTAPSSRSSDRPSSVVKAKFARSGRVDIAVLVVTYNNAVDVDPLVASLRRQIGELTVRVVVADNNSTDATVEVLAQHDDIIVVATGGNLGYAAGINRAMKVAGEAEAFLVLNPDLVAADGALAAMLARSRSHGVGAVVPLLLDPGGTRNHSLRHEPHPLRSLGDALFGARLRWRPGWLSELVFAPTAYEYPHPVDWATGAAILIRAELARSVGSWDERFFLYSEETDYCRRVRNSGATIWFEPNATMTHRRGGSGLFPALTALMQVNRVRYARIHHGSWAVATLLPILILQSALRVGQRGHRLALLALVSSSHRQRLPGRRTRGHD
ncbi:glycosyltransferase family 2 protein [Georgenia yuyongxinii]|uniref:glycosyltransferase family 2 protein n=1 Tax=Georgenia yuyongxinii TaxID=2589797 RepID=UPI00143D10E6|nr:glycosyltransferase family 2 protein [Georgenia yuyongxinii]